MSQGADPDEIGLMNIDEQLPVLEYPQPGLDIIQVWARVGFIPGLLPINHSNSQRFYTHSHTDGMCARGQPARQEQCS